MENLAQLAAKILRDASQRAGQRGVELSLDVQADAYVHGSEGLLAIAIQNLLDNAIRHARDHGAVNVETTCDDVRVELAVSGFGYGWSRVWSHRCRAWNPGVAQGRKIQVSMGAGSLSLTWISRRRFGPGRPLARA